MLRTAFRFSFALLVLSFLAAPAFAQNSVPCDSANTQLLSEQLKRLDRGPDISSFQCTNNGETQRGVWDYLYTFGDTMQVNLIFEARATPDVAILPAVLLGAVHIVRLSYARGWLNDAFLKTGHGDPNSTWTVIQENTPRETIKATFEKSSEGFAKR